MARGKKANTEVSLLGDLRRLLPGLEADLRARAQALRPSLVGEWQQAQQARRTGEAFETWLDGWVTQVAVAWLLSLVCVRHLEDQGWIEPRLAGEGEAGARAEEARAAFIEARPTATDADWLVEVLGAVAALPAGEALFGPHNLVRALAPSGDMGGVLLRFFQRTDGATGRLVHRFESADTRFLGDLYQDLSEAARKRYALLQTPDFVEGFVLDHTLTPALARFGLAGTRVLDPTCGSGHFLLGAFARLLDRYAAEQPGRPLVDRVRRALEQVWGVDVNPFAVAVARFRLLLAALAAAGHRRLAGAPGFVPRVTVADSLLHGAGQLVMTEVLDPSLYNTEDPAAVRATFGQRYAAVVGNPPYITVKDAVLNAAYRRLFPEACHRQYSLGVPFTQQFFQLSEDGGYVGLITANSFMKREFGKKLIEQVLPRYDLTHVIDTAGAYIPGHGTPTVILLGRGRAPTGAPVRAVLGIRGEPSTPANPAQGLVWQSIAQHLGEVGFENEFVSVVDLAVEVLRKHPWSLGGGGAADVLEAIEGRCTSRLDDLMDVVGRTTHTGLDDFFFRPMGGRTRNLGRTVPLVTGEALRDWTMSPELQSLFPYDDDAEPAEPQGEVARQYWRYQVLLRSRLDFQQTLEERGLPWYVHSMFFPARFRSPMGISFAFVATHNHFVLDRGGKVFKQSAPVIKLPAEASEADHLALLGLLNSSTACFWMKQVMHCKGAQGINEGGKSEKWEQFYEFAGTPLAKLPLVSAPPAVLALATALDAEATALTARLATLGVEHTDTADLDARQARLIALQEALDWEVYAAYGLLDAESIPDLVWTPGYAGILPASASHAGRMPAYPGGTPGRASTDPSLPPLRPGERAFEIVLARRLADGEVQTAWFERHGATPTPEVPAHWPADYRALVERRIAAIEAGGTLGLLEAPEYKRRWSAEDHAARIRQNARAWLLDRLETPPYLPDMDGAPPAAVSTTTLAARAAADADFLRVAHVYAGAELDLPALVRDLVLGDAVPDLPAHRYKEAGLRKRAIWEAVWALQRREDAGERVRIPVPPAYTSADFKSSVYWSLRGKLDVPKERFIHLPYARRPTETGEWVLWAGLDHLARAQALAALYLERRDVDGLGTPALLPFLASLDQLEPWLFQWHHTPDPRYGDQRMSETFRAFTEAELATHGADRATAKALAGVVAVDLDAVVSEAPAEEA